MSAVAGLMLKSDGYPVDDPTAMFPLLVYCIEAITSREGVTPRGVLTVRPLVPATINGIPLDDDAGIRWQLDLE